MKYALMVGPLALALLGTGLYQAPPQDRSEWVVTLEVKQKTAGTDPVARINVVVRAHSEGEAAIKAYNYIQGLLRDEDRLTYLEAGLRK